MSQPCPSPTTPGKPRRWFQFTLRTALGGMVVLAVALGWLSDRTKLQSQLAHERAEKDALRAARDYDRATQPALATSSSLMARSGSMVGAWSGGYPSSRPAERELDEATVEHLKEYLGDDPVVTGPGRHACVSYSGPNPPVFDSTPVSLYDEVFSCTLQVSAINQTLLSPAQPIAGPTYVHDVPAKDAEAIPALIKLLQDSDATKRARAACTLARIGRNAKDAVPALVDRLKDADLAVRYHAAYALGRIGAWPTVQALREAVDQDDSPAGPFAAQMLRRLDWTANPVPRLVELLDHRDVETRRAAVRALAKIGTQHPVASLPATDTSPALPKLKRLCADPDSGTSKQAMIAVACLASPADAHATLGEIVRAGQRGDKGVWTLASLLWNRFDRQVRAAQAP